MCFSAAAFIVATAAFAERATPVVGAQEGGAFEARCPARSNLVGLEVYSRDDIDALRPICASLVARYDANGEQTIETPSPAGDPVGGAAAGANLTVLRCPPEAPIVTGAKIGIESDNTYAVNAITLECGGGGTNAIGSLMTGGTFTAPRYDTGGGLSGFSGVYEKVASCPRSFGTYVAVGVQGYAAGDWIHGLGFVCSDAGSVVKKVGRDKPRVPVGLGAGARVTGPGVGATVKCEAYAAKAVAAAIEARNEGCGFTGVRWTADNDVQLNWCLSVDASAPALAAEETVRNQSLAECRAARN